MTRLFRQSSGFLLGAVLVFPAVQPAPIQDSANLALSASTEDRSAQAAPASVSKELIDEVWQIVNDRYIDPGFNGQDWNAVRQQFLQNSYDSDRSIYRAIEEMLATLGDPLTRFMTPEVFTTLQIDTGRFGIGLSLTRQGSEVAVVAAFENSPASRAGIFPGDILVNVDGTDIRGMSLEEAVLLLRGEVGSPVTVTVQREQRQLEFRIVREPFEIRPVRYAKQDSAIGAIGYIRFNQFSYTASAEMQAAINDLESQGVAGYVLDLRNNPGGLFDAASEIAQMWIDRGTIVTMYDRDNIAEPRDANGTALTEKPLVVLVNKGSSSASEILAGALQDNQRAILVGTETSGNNSIQLVRALSNGSGLALTVAKWYPPSGRDIAAAGIVPDVSVELTPDQQQALLLDSSLLGTANDPHYVQAISVLQRARSQ